MTIVVSKFGGSSMADAAAMLRSASIATNQQSNIVLVSATYGTTDKLINLSEVAMTGDFEACEKILFEIEEKHISIAKELSVTETSIVELKKLLGELRTLAKGISLLKDCSLKAKDNVLSLGERMSSLLFATAMAKTQTQRNVQLVDIREVLITDSNHGKATPILETISRRARKHIPCDDHTVYIGQGFIGSDEAGATTTLGRGGSDYSASLIAEGVSADTLEIWTDVAGIATTDPRICEKARSISEITFAEASELATYGAKILHPTTLAPAMRKGIPVYVGSSYQPEKPGTWIKLQTQTENKPLIRALTKRDGQAIVTVRTPKMMHAFGFMSRIFDIFNEYKISVDCVTTSEISVAVTVERNVLMNKKFLTALRDIGTVEIEDDLSLISIIGNKMRQTAGVGERIFESLRNINVRMVCLGASEHNFCFIVEGVQAELAIQKLHKTFIESPDQTYPEARA